MSTSKTWAARAVAGTTRPGAATKTTVTAASVTARPKTRTTESERLMQQGLGLAGSLLMPLGLIAIGLGWFGAAHTPYTFEQVAYLVSGGIGGLALTTLGGFLFFGSWLARIAHQQRQQTELLAGEIARLADAILTLEGGE
ncbi:hypothetical protein [Catenulispora subtropica]|uniref:Integral membrane protein n=1 Tax=Catenulispora subtropica TaxID=450798 RepID=A0ABN2T6X9_9ACTN